MNRRQSTPRPTVSVASLYLQARIFNYLDWTARPATFSQIHHHLAAVASKEVLESAIADLEARGLLMRAALPPSLVARWRAFANSDPFPEGAHEFLAQCAAVLARLEWEGDR